MSESCVAWGCAACLPELRAHYYGACLTAGRSSWFGGRSACLATDGCAWNVWRGWNFWSGGSLQCVLDHPPCCETPGAESSCFQLGRPFNEPWRADDDCPWVCRQGWQRHVKPACCPEVRGGGYDVCVDGECACDAACRACCDVTAR